MVEAARKYKRVIQVGMRSRSASYIKQAKDLIAEGKIGDVHLVRVFNMMQHPFQRTAPEQPVPSGLDYDTWCGPAAKLPYTPSRSWLNLWEYSCGPIPGDAVHQLDLARYIMGDIPYPKNVAQMGAIYSLKDGRDTPDTQLATYAYDKFTLLFESSLWTPYLKKTPGEIRDSDGIPQWQFNSTRIEVLGTKGMMYVGRHGDGLQVFNNDGAPIVNDPGKQSDKEHINNFLDCIRTRKKPIADVEQGHYSALLCHMANCSFRCGNQQLELDPATETFTNNPEANKYIKRSYRAPWLIPDPV
jgi:predicted dehydrogenase